MRAPLLFIAALALPARAVDAQQPESAATRTVHTRVTVYDSLTRTPLAGALLQVAREGATESTSGIADASGQVDFDLGLGPWLASIVHPRLDSIGVTLPPRRFEVKAGRRSRVTIATASARTLLHAYCGNDVPDESGVLVGYVHDARTQAAVAEAQVVVQWADLLLADRQFRRERQTTSTRADSTGWFVLCGIPAADQMVSWAGNDTSTTAVVLVTSPTHGITRFDFWLDRRVVATTDVPSDSTAAPRRPDERPVTRAVAGGARLRLAVLDATGHAIAGARANVYGRIFKTTDDRGLVTLDSLQAGTQMLEARAVGYMPESRVVNVSTEYDTPDTIMLASVKSVLDTVRVTARTVFDADVNGFGRRHKLGFGAFITRADVDQRRPLQFSELLWAVPGVEVEHPSGRAVITMRSSASLGRCAPSIFLDGWELQGDDRADVDLLARTDQIAGVEVYNSPNRVPAQFQTITGNCGAIAIWTRRVYKQPKRPDDKP